MTQPNQKRLGSKPKNNNNNPPFFLASSYIAFDWVYFKLQRRGSRLVFLTVKQINKVHKIRNTQYAIHIPEKPANYTSSTGKHN